MKLDVISHRKTLLSGPTLRAVDAAGAARGLGAIFACRGVPSPVPVYGGCQQRN